MNYTKQYINKLGEETNFINSNLEKVVRLLDVLDYIFTKSSFSNDVVLKGGTAINLVCTNLKRLSVDIDLDYQGSLEKEKAFVDKEKIANELDDYMANNGYNVSPKSRESVALFSRMYQYTNAFGNVDYIKIEINFMDRVYIYPTILNTFHKFDKTITIRTPSKEELYGMKICALIDRSKPRDLYDVDYLFHNFVIADTEKLRKCAIFYLSLDGIFSVGDSSYKGIKSISQLSIKKELQPVIQKGGHFNLEESTTFVINKLKELLQLSDDEKSYLFEFSRGNFKPSLLFQSPFIEKANMHPMAKWRIINLKK